MEENTTDEIVLDLDYFRSNVNKPKVALTRYMMDNNGEPRIEFKHVGTDEAINLNEGSFRYNTYAQYVHGIIDDIKLNDYIEAEKNRIENNCINDKDKVFFSKSSIFPRTAFNRYSNKARLVQTVKAATKFVVPIDTFTQLRTYPVSSLKLLLEDKIDGSTKEVNVILEPNVLLNSFSYAYTSEHATSTLYKLILEAKATRYNYTKNAYKVLADFIAESASTFYKKNVSIVSEDNNLFTKVVLLGSNKKTDYESIQLLLDNDIKSDQLVLDETVNTYIDSFKDSLDDSFYEYLKETLNAEKPEFELPMQLLSNMVIEEDNPRLDALFLLMNPNSLYKLSYDKVMNTIDLKNFSRKHNLDEYFSHYKYLHNPNLTEFLNILSKRLKYYKNNTGKTALIYLVKGEIEKLINAELGQSIGKVTVNVKDITDI